MFDADLFDPKEFSQATDQELDAIEALTGYPLPAAYRDAMLAGTGSSMRQMMAVGDMDVDLAGIIRAAPRHKNDYAMPNVWAIMQNRLPKGWLPFARSSGGDMFCIAMKGGRVALYAPDMAPDDGPMAEADLIPVAKTLPDFAAMLAPFHL